MLESKSDIIYDHPSKTFTGVRFVLLGFDPINKDKARSRLVNGGGVDVGRYGPDCTHVIVDKLVYDDPVCAAARNDGKALVTGLWVDHSFDVGMPVDTASIMYRPVKDLSGIPGSKSLVVCLTGYQRQDRDDIMTMVGLMGANFSKPLVANKVTHLICYKFEGEKYELAKKMKKIKLVNHRWLEDCLKAWEILPETEYDKSGYELEMEAEAKDSDEEAEDMDTSGGRNGIASACNLQVDKRNVYQSPKLLEEISRNDLNSYTFKGFSISNTNVVASDVGKETSDQASLLHEICTKHPKTLVYDESHKDVSSGKPSIILHDGTPSPAKVGNLASSTGNAKRSPHSDAVTPSSMNYSQKTYRRAKFALHCGGVSSTTPVGGKCNANDDFSIFSSKLQEEGADFGYDKSPAWGLELCPEEAQSDLLPGKRKMDVSYVSSKSQKKTHDPAKISRDKLVLERTEVVEPAAVSSDHCELASHSSNTHNMAEITALDPAQNSPVNIMTMTSGSSVGKPTKDGMPVSKSVTSNIQKDGGVDVSPQTTFVKFNDVVEPQNKPQDTESLSRTRELGMEKSNSPADLLAGAKTDSQPKALRKKMLAKRSSGSGSRQGKGNVGNQKGSIYLNCSVDKKETVHEKNLVNTVQLETSPLTVDVDAAMMTEIYDVPKCVNEVGDKIVSMDDETEAPKDEEKNEVELTVRKEKLGLGKSAGIPDKVTEEKSEATLDATYDKTCSLHDAALTSGKDKNETQSGRTVCVKKNELSESKHLQNDKARKTKGKKWPLCKIERKSLSTVTNHRTFKEGSNQEEGRSAKNNNEADTMKEENVTHPACKVKRSANKSENHVEMEKENKPIYNGEQNVDHIKQAKKADSDSIKTPKKIDIKTGDNQNLVQMKQIADMSAEPMWFILCGHRLQRREFQQVIRHLKGRVCRDSHQWSYQATHFIVPDPIRRTEKFFAAAASGRWILKTEYLTASSQAGRLLAEEPYEWHKNELSEDGAINLEAPRKWRLVRERTGHGAFYRMRIIIYGECIAPPLDTLKRVVKAGDGTILATSPPYTRFLQSGVDFAIVSPGMPRVDMWVQEFLRHEIPCVVADYLVEYVCKPGYSLERHVQYNTHAWAERSFKKLVNRMEEIVENLMSPEDSGNDDLRCQVCGSRERGEVMLICGNECGTMGCGIGAHIDCCNPPLEDVPEGDWFCVDCCNMNKSCHKK